MRLLQYKLTDSKGLFLKLCKTECKAKAKIISFSESEIRGITKNPCNKNETQNEYPIKSFRNKSLESVSLYCKLGAAV